MRDLRPVDADIHQDEPLFRWLASGDVNGSEVLPHAIDLEGTFVDRSKYAPLPQPAFQHNHPERTGLAEVCGRCLPEPFDDHAVTYEFFVVDCPVPTNEAHAEIRLGRLKDPPDRPENFKPKSKATKERARSALARSLRVIRAP